VVFTVVITLRVMKNITRSVMTTVWLWLRCRQDAAKITLINALGEMGAFLHYTGQGLPTNPRVGVPSALFVQTGFMDER
jgi:hypothetical protein